MKLVKVVVWTLASLALLLAFAIAVFGDRDIDPDILVERYASDASQFLELPGGTVAHVRDEGNPAGETLMLVHGSNASLHAWEPWVSLLGDEFRMVSIDLPGHGLTGATKEADYSIDGMAEFVDAVADKMRLERFHLAGSSMGGRMSWVYALTRPERVDHLVLLDASGFPTEGPSGAIGLRIARMPGIQELTRFFAPQAAFEASLHGIFFDPTFVTDEMVTRYQAMQLRRGTREASLERFRLRIDDPRVTKIGTLTQPTLILWGEEDRLTPVAFARRFHEVIPKSTLRIYPNVGHVPMEEIPERTASDVRAFLKDESTGSPAF